MARFKDIIGHEQVIEHLQSAIQLKKVSHAYMLDGEDGMGKNLLAQIYAQTLQCEEKGIEPCMQCKSCKQTESKNQPDIIYVSHEKIGSIGVDDVRVQVCGDIQIKPYSSPYKIYIIDEAEKLTVQAQNALLKTIEEPPSYGIIILLTTNTDILLPTIISRCVTLKLKPLKMEEIKKYLMEEIHIPDYEAELCATFSRGNLGKAVKLANSEEFLEMKSHMLFMVKHLEEMDLGSLIENIKKLVEFKSDIYEYLDLVILWFRDVLLFKATREVDTLVFSDELGEIRSQAEKRSYEGLNIIIEAVEKAKVRLRANVNFELALELMFLTTKEN